MEKIVKQKMRKENGNVIGKGKEKEKGIFNMISKRSKGQGLEASERRIKKRKRRREHTTTMKGTKRVTTVIRRKSVKRRRRRTESTMMLIVWKSTEGTSSST